LVDLFELYRNFSCNKDEGAFGYFDYFAELRKAASSFVVSACLSVHLFVRMEQVGLVFTRFDI